MTSDQFVKYILFFIWIILFHMGDKISFVRSRSHSIDCCVSLFFYSFLSTDLIKENVVLNSVSPTAQRNMHGEGRSPPLQLRFERALLLSHGEDSLWVMEKALIPITNKFSKQNEAFYLLNFIVFHFSTPWRFFGLLDDQDNASSQHVSFHLQDPRVSIKVRD